MKFLFKLASIITILAFVLWFAAIPAPAHAQLPGVPFGGFNVFMFPCTCSAGAMWWHFYAPAYISSPVPLAMAFSTLGNVVSFSYYYIHPGQWAKGTYQPGGGAGCWIGVAPYCVWFPNIGLITPYTGTSP